MHDALAENESGSQARAAMEDAARYRFIRDSLPERWALHFRRPDDFEQSSWRHDPSSKNICVALDAAIDSALKAEAKKS